MDERGHLLTTSGSGLDDPTIAERTVARTGISHFAATELEPVPATSATTRQHPAATVPCRSRDQDNSVSCLSCGHLFAWGDTGRPIGYGSVHGRPHDLVVLVPEPRARWTTTSLQMRGGSGHERRGACAT